MKLAIISDIHDNTPNLTKALDWCRKQNITTAICPGDVCNADTLAQLAGGFQTVYVVRGNADTYEHGEEAQHKAIIFLGREGGVAHLGDKTVGVCHEPRYIDDVLEKDRCDYVFYGHTHTPWEEQRSGARIVNPGTLGGGLHQATFAVWNPASGDLELQLVGKL